MMYYVVEYQNYSPEALRVGSKSADYCEIRTEPARTNLSREEVVDGWLGQTNDINRNAQGGFATIEEARAKCAELGYTGYDYPGCPDPGESFEAPVVEAYHVAGQEWDVADWMQYYDPADDGLCADSTKEEIAKVADCIVKEALDSKTNGQGEPVRLLGDVAEYITRAIARKVERA